MLDFICYFCVFKRYLKSCMMTKRKLLYILAATVTLLFTSCNRQRNEADLALLKKADSLLSIHPEDAADSLKHSAIANSRASTAGTINC